MRKITTRTFPGAGLGHLRALGARPSHAARRGYQVSAITQTTAPALSAQAFAELRRRPQPAAKSACSNTRQPKYRFRIVTIANVWIASDRHPHEVKTISRGRPAMPPDIRGRKCQHNDTKQM